MSAYAGGCAKLEVATGMPAPSGGCCWSCIDDDGKYMIELYADDDQIPNVAPDAWFRVCCAHFRVYEAWRAQHPTPPHPNP